MRLCDKHDGELVNALRQRELPFTSHRATSRRYFLGFGPTADEMTRETFDARLVAYGSLLCLTHKVDNGGDVFEAVGHAARCPICAVGEVETRDWIDAAANVALQRWKGLAGGNA